MDIKFIKDTLAKLDRMVDNWNANEQVSDIERSLAMDKLKELYEELMWNTSTRNVVEESDGVDCELKIESERTDVNDEQQQMEIPEKVEVLPKMPVFDISNNEFSTDFTFNEMGSNDLHEKELTEENPCEETEPIAPSEPASEFKPASKQPEYEMHDMFSRPNKSANSVLRSLYDEEEDDALPVKNTYDGIAAGNDARPIDSTTKPIPSYAIVEPEKSVAKSRDESVFEHLEQTKQPEPEQNPFGDSQSKTVLGEVINAGETTLGESMAATGESDMATRIATQEADTIRGSIGINDKFLLIRDLFAGDSIAYEGAVDKLESFDNLEDAMLYIHDNFKWNPNSDGAKLLVDIITRKLM